MKISFYENCGDFLDENFMSNPNGFLFHRCFTYRMKNLIMRIENKFIHDGFGPLFLMWWLFAGPIYLLMCFFEEKEYKKVLFENQDEYKRDVYINIYDEENKISFRKAFQLVNNWKIDTHDDQTALEKLNIDKIIIKFLENIGIHECSIFFEEGSVYLLANKKQVEYIKEAFVDLGVEVDDKELNKELIDA